MCFGSHDNDVVPRRSIVIRDIVTAFVIFGVAVIVVWYAVMHQSATTPIDSPVGAGSLMTPIPQGGDGAQQSRAVVYVAYPCEACHELLSALASFNLDHDSTSQAPDLIYRPTYLNTVISKQAAYALLCAQEQTMFEAYYSALPEPSEASHSTLWQDTAQEIGLDQAAFVTCFESEQTAAQVAVYTNIMHEQGDTTPPVVELTSLLTDTTDPTHIRQFIQQK